MKQRTFERDELYQSSWDQLISEGVITLRGWEYLRSLADVVVHRYYPFAQDLSELESDVVVDAACFLRVLEVNTRSGRYPAPRNTRNVIFTRMRNHASNYTYHMRRIAERECVDTELFDRIVDVECDPLSDIEDAILMEQKSERTF